jgi:hypothetical protein
MVVAARVDDSSRRDEVAHWICSDPYAKFSRWPIGRPIGKAVDPLVYRSTYWPTGTFGVWVNLLAKRSTCWCIGQPIGKVVNRCNKFTMLIPSTKLLVYTLREPLNLFFLPLLCMPFPCHSCCTLSSNCCIGSLSCTQSSQSASWFSSLGMWSSIYHSNFCPGGKW